MPEKETFQKNFFYLEGEVRKNLGKLILIVSETEKISGCPGVRPTKISSSNIALERKMYMGTPTSHLLIGNGLVTFPMGFHASKNDYAPWKLTGGAIEIPAFSLLNFKKTIEPNQRKFCSSQLENPEIELQSALNVYFGEDVGRYFSPNAENSYLEALSLLGLKVTENPRVASYSETGK